MHSPRISSSRIVEPRLSRALLEHSGERAEILEWLTNALKSDQGVRAAQLWGSFMRGEQDDLSDLDLWLYVTDDRVESLALALEGCCSSAGDLVTFGEAPHNAPPGGGYCSAMIAGTHGLHQLDIYWQPVSMCACLDRPALASGFDWQTAEPVTLPSSAILFNRMRVAPEPTEAIQHTQPERDYDNKLSFVWLMTSIAAKYLARDPSSDMSLLRYAKPSFEGAVSDLSLEAKVGEVEWWASAEPMDKVDLLRRITSKTAVIEEACRDRGLRISTAANPCLQRYFDLVEGILKHAQY